MAKPVQEKTEHTYQYPIQDIFRVITESIIKQMQGAGHKNNLNLNNPVGKESNYILKRGTKEIPVHFEVLTYEKPTQFSYLFVVDRTQTETEWILEDFADNTTKVTYIERARNTSFINRLIKMLNRKKFHRTANGYFYMIDTVLEKEAKEK